MFTQPFRADTPRLSRQQQQAQQPDKRQQQQGGSEPEFQSRQQQAQDADKMDKSEKIEKTNKADSPAQQMGEGSYEATRDYQESIKTYLDKADVKSDAEAAEPTSPAEADELKKAEDEGLSHTKAPGQ